MKISKIKLYLKAARVEQWIKNLIVFTAPLFSGKLLSFNVLAKTTLSFILMTLLSSASYMINDLADIKLDRKHPIKKNALLLQKS